MLEELAAPLSEFRQQTGSHLEIRQGNDRRAEELLLSDEADLAAALEPDRRDRSPKIRYEPAYTVEFFGIAPSSHPYAKTRSSRLSELAKHELIVTTIGTHGRDALDDAFDREKLRANIVVETDNSAFTIACVSAGMGVGILAGRPSGELTQDLATRSLSHALGKRRIVLMWRKGRLLPDRLVRLVETIQALESS